MSEAIDVRLTKIMDTMGFPASETGPYVTELRKLVRSQIEDGLTYRSYGSWARNDISTEERARAHLGMDWAISHGRSYRTETLERLHFTRYNVRTRKRVFDTNLFPWLGDRWREGLMLLRVFRDRNQKNPYTREVSP